MGCFREDCRCIYAVLVYGSYVLFLFVCSCGLNFFLLGLWVMVYKRSAMHLCFIVYMVTGVLWHRVAVHNEGS